MVRKTVIACHASKIDLFLVFTVMALLIVFGILTSVVTVPAFRKNGSASNSSTGSSDLARYAVIPENFPDPCLINDWEGKWYAFATRTNNLVHVQVASAPQDNISEWTLHEGYDALPTLGAWAATQLTDSAVWAPYVVNTVSLLSLPSSNF